MSATGRAELGLVLDHAGGDRLFTGHELTADAQSIGHAVGALFGAACGEAGAGDGAGEDEGGKDNAQGLDHGLLQFFDVSNQQRAGKL